MRSAYIGLIRSVIEYGCVVYRSASYTSLLRLDRIQAKALRRCCEAVKSTSLSALQSHNEIHPAKKIIRICWESSKVKKESFCTVISNITEDSGITTRVISQSVLLPQPTVDFSILEQTQPKRKMVTLQAYVNIVLHENFGFCI